MSETKLQTGTISFQTEGRLLQELGERLVASPEVALVELIKNAYDADSPSCDVRLSNNKTLIVQDRGLGMTYNDFETRWMRIATSHKVGKRTSTKYGRRLTGQKGIGRFAVRFLGNCLRLNTVAFDETRNFKTRLVADFDWAKIDEEQNLDVAKIPFQLLQVAEEEPIGTTLTVSKLKTSGDFTKSTTFRTSVLKIVSPLEGLERGRFSRSSSARDDDPGFHVTLPGDTGPTEDELDLAKQVLAHAWARLTVDLSRQKGATFCVYFHDDPPSQKPRKLDVRYKTTISNGLFAYIRFFPRRQGVFRAKEVDGLAAWDWVRENHGVAVVDHGFRTKPYGFLDDDWLMLDIDRAHNRRDWRTQIALKHFSIPKPVRDDPALNPMLNLPSTYQLVGAVFVESKPPSVSRAENDLTPSMDREGFLENKSSKDLFQIVRAGLEFLAKEDKRRLLDEKDRRAKEAAQKIRSDFKEAVDYIQQSPTLTRSDKARLVEEYSGLSRRLEEVEEYDREARRKLEIMSSLGVVAGFITHEATRITASLGEATEKLRTLARQYPSLVSVAEEIEQTYNSFQGHIDYTRMFIDSVQEGTSASFKSAAQVRRIIAKFGSFAHDRGIDVDYEIEDNVQVPSMPVAVYSGVLLNLYTNALKAIMAAKTSKEKKRIVFRGWNDTKFHVIEVLDTGIGIPPNLRKRVWDPLFTTTSRLNNPLGSGMGLGLSLVRQLVNQVGGRIDIVDAPKGFNTCLRVEFPLKKRS